MKDRYEIKGKIGQGGIGAVYRAWDRRLNRDVAIKRVLPEGGFENEQEAIAHLLKEATALSSVQHPHIVTVYDAGVDDDGPYVVMELLSGRTLDQMIEQGTLVWSDFRDVAIQTQEALIAAQDLNLVHRDLKPTNIMVIWLASGKFQIKIVDFGLAKFSPKPSLQTIDHGDAVFGSIHFMAPEQFERDPLDQRTDMYAMGCLYYFCLTGLYPFTGELAAQVMSAHLQHVVTPLHTLRPDLPEWVCDWVMWHIRRNMDDRPSNARQSLKKFLMNEEQNPTSPDGSESPPEARPKFVFPGGADGMGNAQPAPQPDPTAGVPLTPGTAPQPIQPPVAQPPVVQHPAPVPATPVAPRMLTPAPQQPPQQPPVQQPATPHFHTPGAPAHSTTNVPLPGGYPAAQIPGRSSPLPAGSSTIISGSTAIAKKKGMSTAAKSTLAAVLGLAVLFIGFLVLSKMDDNRKAKRVTALLAEVQDPKAKDLPTTADDVEALLAAATDISANAQRQSVYQRLLLAKASDGSDLDAQIAAYAATDENQMISDIRTQLFSVLQGRKSPSALPYLIDYARSSSNEQTAAAALKASEKIATSDNLADLLNIMRYTRHDSVRQAAKRTIAAVAKRTDGAEELAAALKTAYETAPDDDVKRSYLELLGSAGGDDAASIVKSALEDDDKKTQVAALAALRAWPDDSMFETLIEYASGQEDDMLRGQSFETAYAFLKLDRDRDELDLEDMWKMLASEARTPKEKRQIIDGMAQLTDEWAFNVIYTFEEDKDDQVSYRAEQAREVMETRRKRLNSDEKE